MKSDLKKMSWTSARSGLEWERVPADISYSLSSLTFPQPPQSQPWEPGIQTRVLAAGPREAADNRTESWWEGWALLGPEALYPLPHGDWRKGRGEKKRTERSGAEPLFPYKELWPMTSWPSPLLGARGISLPDIRLRSRERWAAG